VLRPLLEEFGELLLDELGEELLLDELGEELLLDEPLLPCPLMLEPDVPIAEERSTPK